MTEPTPTPAASSAPRASFATFGTAHKAVALALLLSLGGGTALTSSGCIGSFGLTNMLYKWNRGLGSLVVQEIVFFLFGFVLPVYGLFILGDVLIFNLIEAITGSHPVSSAALDDQGTRFVVEKTDPARGAFRTELVRASGERLVRQFLPSEDGLGMEIRDGDGLLVASARLEKDGSLRIAGASGELLAVHGAADVDAVREAVREAVESGSGATLRQRMTDLGNRHAVAK